MGVSLKQEKPPRLRGLLLLLLALSRKPGGLAPTDLVFAHLDGSPLDPSTVSHTFGKVVRKAGIKNVRFHDLRHAHASLMLRTGASPKVISERLGHSSIAITMDIYSPVMPGL